jgi:autotransporter-associated beta strand protein
MNINGGELAFTAGSLGSNSTINVGSATLGWYGGNTQDVSARVNLNSAATAVFNIPSGTVTFVSPFKNNGASSTASVTKLGAGTLEIGAVNDFSGGLTVSAGTLKATANGAVGSGAVSISRNATLVVNAILANKINVTAGGMLAGNGESTNNVDGTTIEEGGILSPNTDSIGSLSFNKLTLNGGSHVKWQLEAATGAAGVGYDTLVISVLNLNNALSSNKKIMVDVTSTGSFLNFDKTKTNQFKFATLTTALANGINVTDLFSIDAEQFEIAHNLVNDRLVWSMQLSADRDMMYVTTMIPEPSTYGLGLGALALALAAIRRRQKKKI